MKLYRAVAVDGNGRTHRARYLTTRAGVSAFKGWVTKNQRFYSGGLHLTVDMVEISDDMWVRFLPQAETLSELIHTASEEDLEQFRVLVNYLAAQVTNAGLKLLLDDAAKVSR